MSGIDGVSGSRKKKEAIPHELLMAIILAQDESMEAAAARIQASFPGISPAVIRGLLFQHNPGLSRKEPPHIKRRREEEAKLQELLQKAAALSDGQVDPQAHPVKLGNTLDPYQPSEGPKELEGLGKEAEAARLAARVIR